MPLSVVALATREWGQPVVEVGHIGGIVEVSLNALSFILAKRKQDDGAGVSGRNKSRAPLSLHTLRQATGLMPGLGCSSSLQDLPLAPLSVEAFIALIVVIPPSSPPPVVPIQEVSSTAKVSVLAALARFCCGTFVHCRCTLAECQYGDHECSCDAATFFFSSTSSSLCCVGVDVHLFSPLCFLGPHLHLKRCRFPVECELQA